MFKHILVATDGSKQADKAIVLALQVADGLPDVRVSALLVEADYGLAGFARATFVSPPGAPTLREALGAQAHRRLEALLHAHGERAMRIQPLVEVSDQAAEAIVDTAKRQGCDLIVMAPRGRGAIAGALLGSQTQRVVALSSVPVLVAT